MEKMSLYPKKVENNTHVGGKMCTNYCKDDNFAIYPSPRAKLKNVGERRLRASRRPLLLKNWFWFPLPLRFIEEDEGNNSRIRGERTAIRSIRRLSVSRRSTSPRTECPLCRRSVSNWIPLSLRNLKICGH
jgi:hypothetical protein